MISPGKDLRRVVKCALQQTAVRQSEWLISPASCRHKYRHKYQFFVILQGARAMQIM
jgi:hypothetical protein